MLATRAWCCLGCLARDLDSERFQDTQSLEERSDCPNCAEALVNSLEPGRQRNGHAELLAEVDAKAVNSSGLQVE